MEASKAIAWPPRPGFQRTNQDVAFRVVTAYFNLITAQERLEASHQIVKTAQTTQEAAEAQLANGRSTLPDVLNARAAAAQASLRLQASIGAVDTARVVLRETIGVEPSDAILVEQPAGIARYRPKSSNQPQAWWTPRGNSGRTYAPYPRTAPGSECGVQGGQGRISAYRFISGHPRANRRFGRRSTLPVPIRLVMRTKRCGALDVTAHWTIFDGGLRRNEVLLADSKRREALDEKREKEDAIGREVWIAYVQFRTAVRQQEAAETLLTSASTSYDASLDAYKYGVKNLVDLVTAENQLAQARLAVVQSRSAVRIDAANLDYATGTLLRQQPPVAQPATKNP